LIGSEFAGRRTPLMHIDFWLQTDFSMESTIL
jgi:hypothetical protein